MNASTAGSSMISGEFRQQRQPGEHAGGKPPARIAALVQPDQRPQHRDRKRDQRGVGRDLGHQQAVIKRGLRHQHREHDRAKIMRDAPDDIGEQQLRDQHRQHAGEPHAEIGVAEDRGAEADEPGDARADDRGRKARSPSTRSSNRPRRCAARSRRHRSAASAVSAAISATTPSHGGAADRSGFAGCYRAGLSSRRFFLDSQGVSTCRGGKSGCQLPPSSLPSAHKSLGRNDHGITVELNPIIADTNHMDRMAASSRVTTERIRPRHRPAADPPRQRRGAVRLSGQPFPQPCARQYLDGGACHRRPYPHAVLAIPARHDRVLCRLPRSYRARHLGAVSSAGNSAGRRSSRCSSCSA